MLVKSEREGNKVRFWDYSPTNGNPIPIYPDLYKFYADRGFNIHIDTTVPENKRLELYRVRGEKFFQYADNTDFEITLKNFFENEVVPEVTTVGKREPEVKAVAPKDILNAFQKHGYKKIHDPVYWTNLPAAKPDLIKDDRDTAWVFFANKAVKITAEGIEFIPYEETTGLVDESLIIPHNIKRVNVHQDESKLEIIAPKAVAFSDYLNKVCLQLYPDQAEIREVIHEIGKEAFFASEDGQYILEDDGYYYVINGEKREYLLKLMGYLMHGYRQRGYTDFYPYFLDDEGGGSGKGLVMEAISQIVNVCHIDAGTWKPGKELPKSPADLKRNTRVKLYNDTPRNFDTSVLRNEITDRQVIEYKFKDKITLPYNEGWKCAATSNYFPKGSDDAEQRRIRPIFFHRYFNKKRNVAHHYKQAFFSQDWKAGDWDYFYNLMFEALRLWLSCEYNLDQYQDEILKAMKLSRYRTEFIEFADQILPEIGNIPTNISKAELWTKFKDSSAYNDKKDTQIGFGKLFLNYCNDTGYSVHQSPNRTELTIWKGK